LVSCFFWREKVPTQCCLRIGFHSFYGTFQKTCVQVLVLLEISLTKISNCLSNCYVIYNPSYFWWFCTEDGFVDKEEFYKIMKKTTLFWSHSPSTNLISRPSILFSHMPPSCYPCQI
jgi:hypothetical protein